MSPPRPPRHPSSSTPPPRPRLKLIAPSASPEEAAAIVAALERFMRATAPPGAPAGAGATAPDEWLRAAILEGVEREGQGEDFEPWINT